MTAGSSPSLKRTIRRQELRQMVPLADSTIYEMEQRGFPRRFAPLAPLRRLGSGGGRSLAGCAPINPDCPRFIGLWRFLG
jgi:hypothetical protein